eukprot:2187673-Pyramimonas_sp.AAC.1
MEERGWRSEAQGWRDDERGARKNRRRRRRRMRRNRRERRGCEEGGRQRQERVAMRGDGWLDGGTSKEMRRMRR